MLNDRAFSIIVRVRLMKIDYFWNAQNRKLLSKHSKIYWYSFIWAFGGLFRISINFYQFIIDELCLDFNSCRIQKHYFNDFLIDITQFCNSVDRSQKWYLSAVDRIASNTHYSIKSSLSQTEESLCRGRTWRLFELQCMNKWILFSP